MIHTSMLLGAVLNVRLSWKGSANMDQHFEVRDLRSKEFFQVNDTYLNGWAKKCGIYATGVYFVLCRHCDKEQTCFPSVRLIASKLKISDRQVTRALGILKQFNIIKIEEAPGCKNFYYLIDKKHWSTPDCQSPLTGSHYTPDCQSGQPLTGSLTKETHRRKHNKDMFKSDNLDLSFSEFWKAYPKRQAKQDATKAWLKLNPDPSLCTAIMEALENQKIYKDNLKKSGAFCPEWPLPASWLSGRRWEDEIPFETSKTIPDDYFTKPEDIL
jgi:hypothetical protein